MVGNAELVYELDISVSMVPLLLSRKIHSLPNMSSQFPTYQHNTSKTMDGIGEIRLAIDGLLKTVFGMFLLSGLACEVYVLFHPVCIRITNVN